MALSRAVFIFAIIATIFSTIAVATDFVVGDEKGWTLGVDYQAWAADKVFHLGDTLTFEYDRHTDNVVGVNESDFQSCTFPSTTPVLRSGHDTIILATYGRRWYISGFTDHCKLGQKFVITVLPSQKIDRPPIPSPSALPSPSLVPAPEAAPPSDAPWSATVPRRSLLPKKLLKMIHRNMIAV